MERLVAGPVDAISGKSPSSLLAMASGDTVGSGRGANRVSAPLSDKATAKGRVSVAGTVAEAVGMESAAEAVGMRSVAGVVEVEAVAEAVGIGLVAGAFEMGAVSRVNIGSAAVLSSCSALAEVTGEVVAVGTGDRRAVWGVTDEAETALANTSISLSVMG